MLKMPFLGSDIVQHSDSTAEPADNGLDQPEPAEELSDSQRAILAEIEEVCELALPAIARPLEADDQHRVALQHLINYDVITGTMSPKRKKRTIQAFQKAANLYRQGRRMSTKKLTTLHSYFVARRARA
jgi:hypothetical protein